MTHAQIYCTIAELVADLKLSGDEPRLGERIHQASQFILRHLGRFLPLQATRTLEGVSTETLDLGAPLLSISTVTVDGGMVSDYTPRPRDWVWENGPYTWLEREAGWGTEVVVSGAWGLYDERQALGIAVDQAPLTTTSGPQPASRSSQV